MPEVERTTEASPETWDPDMLDLVFELQQLRERVRLVEIRMEVLERNGKKSV